MVSSTKTVPVNQQQQTETKLTTDENSKNPQTPTEQMSENSSVVPQESVFLIESGRSTGSKTLALAKRIVDSDLPSKTKLRESKHANEIEDNYPVGKNAIISDISKQFLSPIEKTVDKTNPDVNAPGNSIIKDSTGISAVITKESVVTDQNRETAVAKKEKVQKKKNSFFFLSVAAGPDLSFVGGNRSGTARLAGGIGLGYRMKNGLSLRTGFYSGRKIYSASSGSYNPPPVFAQLYPILENVDADCKVYEIPVSIHYNFGKSEKQNWFAGAGLSTLLMKKEDYVYSYKNNAAGPTYTSSWSIQNENKHYFSVLTLSGGYQRQLSKRVAISAEPYLKIPLQGVGYGKVKLNSTGIMLNLFFQPFQPATKK